MPGQQNADPPDEQESDAPEQPTNPFEQDVEAAKKERACPLCSFAAKKQSNLYHHLMATHTKTELVEHIAGGVPVDS